VCARGVEEAAQQLLHQLLTKPLSMLLTKPVCVHARRRGGGAATAAPATN
jgi:hypothetical protein